MKLALTRFSVRHPYIVFLLTAILALGLALQMPKVHFDNDPENMLSQDEPVRIYHHKVKEAFDLYDFVIVGVVEENHENGIFNVETLGRIDTLTQELLSLSKNAEGVPQVTDPQGTVHPVDLRPDSPFKKVLNVAFRHDPNRLFDEAGNTAVIKQEIISPSVVDNIKQAEFGSLKLEYLMESPPRTREEALTIRDDAMNNPLYNGTLVSEDGQAICIYIPIQDKTYSYNVASLVRELTADWPEQVFITGLPVAEDTFGVEMLIQMATSAPMAGLAIFLLLLLFFRRFSLILAPMMVAVFSIVMTMGLLIGLGFDVHIMSSMIAIFLMPIAVADAVHILSEFYDTYDRFKDKAATIEHVVGHLFSPMLFTSLTTIVGFASLALTPIPPVRVFGLHVGFGVGMAWLLTMTFIPAYIMVFVSDKALEGASKQSHEHEEKGLLAGLLVRVGRFANQRTKLILTTTVLLIAVAGLGISRIKVNDNPVKWFRDHHPIRVADEVLNHHFGGTYTAYLTFENEAAGTGLDFLIGAWRQEAERLWPNPESAEGQAFFAALDSERSDASAWFETLKSRAAAWETTLANPWQRVADEVFYLDPEGLTRDGLIAQVEAMPEVERTTVDRLKLETEDLATLEGEALLNQVAVRLDALTAQTPSGLVDDWETRFKAPLFKMPEMLVWLDQLQDHLERMAVVGKTSSAVDALKKASFELQFQEGADNEANLSVPNSIAGVGQVFTQLEGMKKKDSIFHLVTRDYQSVNLWVQLKSGDNRDMERVVEEVNQYMVSTPPPFPIKQGWAGLTYINVEWQAKMVTGMLEALMGSFIFVLIMMIILFRSIPFGVLAMVPLTVTIGLIYGLIGLIGKDYDMPVAVLSSLTLGLSVDFAIHFLQRGREMYRHHGNWPKAAEAMFREPAMAISRNAITISVGFTPLLLAPLVPYNTVGFFLATIMAVSWAATLLILPALVQIGSKWLFRNVKKEA